jgi:5-methylcytosine-specific restriction protein A
MKTKRTEKTKNWNQSEIDLAVKGYVKIMMAQKNEEKINKSALYRQLSEVTGRNPKSIEIRMLNISSWLDKNGHKWATGLKPAGGNIGSNVEKMIETAFKATGFLSFVILLAA